VFSVGLPLLLWGGVALGLSGSPRRYFKILRSIRTEWKAIDKVSLRRTIKRLYESKLVTEKENEDGSITLVLTAEGKQRALTYNLDQIQIKRPAKWDKKWRIVLFDVPEKKRGLRDAIRSHLQQMDFFELQKSVFVHPFPCDNEIKYLTEFYKMGKYVRFIAADSIDNEIHLKKHFDLI